MTVLRRNRPHTQTSPLLEIENRLPVGTHIFELVVIDNAGQASEPDTLTLSVKRRRR